MPESMRVPQSNLGTPRHPKEPLPPGRDALQRAVLRAAALRRGPLLAASLRLESRVRRFSRLEESGREAACGSASLHVHGSSLAELGACMCPTRCWSGEKSGVPARSKCQHWLLEVLLAPSAAMCTRQRTGQFVAPSRCSCGVPVLANVKTVETWPRGQTWLVQ